MIVLIALCAFLLFAGWGEVGGIVLQQRASEKRQTAEENVANRRRCPPLAILRFSLQWYIKKKKKGNSLLVENQFCLIPAFPSYFCAADVKTCLLCPLFPYFLHKQIRVRYNLLIKILQVSSSDSERMEFLSFFF